MENIFTQVTLSENSVGVSRKNSLMNRYVIILFVCFLFPFVLHAQKEGKIKFNAGLKSGVQASTYQNTEFNLDGYKYNNKSQNTRIGYIFSGFLRLSKGRPYIQTEGIFSIEKYNFSFETEQEMTSNTNVPRYRLTNYTLQVPLLFGYYFVDSKPYRMGVFTGVKTKFLLTSQSKQEFENFDFEYAEESLKPVTYSWEIGLEVNIANVCFDFMYEIGLNNTSKSIYIPEYEKTFQFKRNINVLSFSLGVIL